MSLALLARPNRSASLNVQEGPLVGLTLFQFDATISEVFASTSDVTDHPVEEGADVSDHVRRRPREFDVHGWVSNDPIVILASSQFGPAPRTRAEDAYDELLRIQAQAELVTVATSLKDLANMFLASISATRDKDSGRILDATLRLREIIIATTEVTSAPVPAPTKSARAPKANLGRQAAKPVPADVAGVQESALFGPVSSALGG